MAWARRIFMPTMRAARTSIDRAIASCCTSWETGTCWWCFLSTDLVVITPRFLRNGDALPRSSGLPLWCWTCHCLTRARASGTPDVTNTLIADIVLQLLSYVAQVERENIHRRQAEGIAAARARGVRFGRPRKPCPPQFDLVRDSYEAGDITRSQAAKCLGVCVGTFDRWMREAG